MNPLVKRIAAAMALLLLSVSCFKEDFEVDGVVLTRLGIAIMVRKTDIAPVTVLWQNRNRCPEIPRYL